MPTTIGGVGRECAHRRGDVDARSRAGRTDRRRDGRSGRGPGRSMATSGRSRASATVSHVWAFCAPPWRRTMLGRRGAPDERAERPSAVAHHHRLAPHRRRAAPGHAVLVGVLLEHRELVVEQFVSHAVTLTHEFGAEGEPARSLDRVRRFRLSPTAYRQITLVGDDPARDHHHHRWCGTADRFGPRLSRLAELRTGLAHARRARPTATPWSSS